MRHRTRTRNAGRRVLAAGAAGVSDSFAGADGTGLPAHAMDRGPGWTAFGGTWQLLGNKATLATPGAGQEVVVTDARRADGVLTCLVTTAAAGTIDCGLVGRAADDNDYWLLAVGGTGLTLYEKNAGSFTSRAAAAGSFANGTTYRFSLAFAGQTVTAFLGGAQQLQYAAASFNSAATKFGLRCNSGSEAAAPRSAFDDFSFA